MCQFFTKTNPDHASSSYSFTLRELLAQDADREAGFHWLYTLYDALNSAGEDISIIKRSPLYHQSPVPLQLENDPYRPLALGQDQGGWVVDVVRRVDLHTLDASIDCTPSEIVERSA
ncbi:MAG: hypothetical protein GY759_02345 [Chloroflexi bacterium]|nr:hypothetical protein [Chloroflexota bacterium]